MSHLRMPLLVLLGFVSFAIYNLSNGNSETAAQTTALADAKKKAPDPEGVHAHLSPEDGVKTLRQLAVDQGGFSPAPDRISRMHIFVSSIQGRVMIVPPGEPEVDDPFGIEPGTDVNFPFARAQGLNTDVVAFKCESFCSFFAYWEFFER